MITHELGLMADNAHINSSGKLYILGEFRYINAPSYPTRTQRITVVSRWIADVVDVREPIKLAAEVVDEDGDTVIPRSPDVALNFGTIGPAERGKAAAQLVLQLDGLLIPQPGAYAIHFFLNGIPNGQVRFHAVTAPKPAEPANG